ncbi:MAG: hypothetical protein AAFY76_00800, partial [Cyanobacteria bacterium J06649_11]
TQEMGIRLNSSNLSQLEISRTHFYRSFWQDFQERVLDKNFSADGKRYCKSASEAYKDSINAYIAAIAVQGKEAISSEEDFFIIIELGHWLMNRDAGRDKYPEISETDYFNGYQTALKLYEGIDPNHFLDEDLKYNFFASRGLAEVRQGGSLDAAQADFKEAETNSESLNKVSSDLLYNLASVHAKLANDMDAITKYKDALEKADKDSKVNRSIIYRDLGFVYLLSGRTKTHDSNSTGTQDLEDAISSFDAIEDPALMSIAHAGKALAIHYMGDEYTGQGSAESEIASAQDAKTEKSIGFGLVDYAEKLISNPETYEASLERQIKSIAFGSFVAHDLRSDDVIDIFHFEFYCQGSDPRVLEYPSTERVSSIFIEQLTLAPFEWGALPTRQPQEFIHLASLIQS